MNHSSDVLVSILLEFFISSINLFGSSFFFRFCGGVLFYMHKITENIGRYFGFSPILVKITGSISKQISAWTQKSYTMTKNEWSNVTNGEGTSGPSSTEHFLLPKFPSLSGKEECHISKPAYYQLFCIFNTNWRKTTFFFNYQGDKIDKKYCN